MATTIKQTEGVPAAYPSTSPAIELGDVAWQRVEQWIAWRYAPRSASWIVEGPGAWSPPLAPATLTTVEIWENGAWSAVTLPDASPFGGFMLTGAGPYRVTAVVGDDDAEVPAVVWEAVKRLAAYLASKPGKPGARSESVTAGSVSISSSRSPTWMAAAMQNSGAADLLRGLRNV
jgi:hypothetical protein